jgi:hypothetical protein
LFFPVARTERTSLKTTSHAPSEKLTRQFA